MAETFGVTVKDISATALNLSLSALGNTRTESLRAFRQQTC